ncbi:hypothetical protein P3X46_005870 [Hevea brasiliensis]|uniref:DELLA protein n=1 Tax=Hevea brasiliensis TaxID=3981 RepID=A0ABQ9MNG5_HEVBR|nr:DELLA protein RGL1-like [Hevea brasiliensis]KAJ9181816.1 hypothetical protein P3X46_005870 [Hevea brasiliensis]
MERRKNAEGVKDNYGLYHRESLVEGCLFSDYQQQEQEQESYSDYRLFCYDDPRFSIISPPLQLPPWPDHAGEIQNGIQDDVDEPQKKNEHQFSLASLELLKKYGRGFRRLNTQGITEPSNGTLSAQELSTEEIVRIAAERFIQFRNTRTDVASMLDNLFDLSIAGISREEVENVELAEILLASAEKAGNKEYDRASRLLDFCDRFSSNTGNPVQRIVYYFSEALHKRIDRETQKIISKGCGKSKSLAIDQLVIIPNSAIKACHEGVPFYQAAHLSGSQAILENVAEAKRIHIIDLKIRNGLQWTVLMQALASRCNCPLELLKITAVETSSKQLIENTGNRLMSFAQAMNIPFSFKIVMVSSMEDLKEDLFGIETEEVVAVYSEYAIMNLIVLRDQLYSVMRVIRSIKPCIMVVIESEANHNSPVFVNRFVEALFFFSAYFDCVDASMGKDDPNRMIMESLFLGEGIRNIVATEGEDRDIRNVKIDVWRTFFAQFEMVETELSESCLHQANLAVKNFPCGKYCTTSMDGKSLIVGWKGTPILSLSTWKFICQKEEEACQEQEGFEEQILNC